VGRTRGEGRISKKRRKWGRMGRLRLFGRMRENGKDRKDWEDREDTE